MYAQSVTTRFASMPREQLLRLALKLDAMVTGANGVAYLVAAGPLEDLLGLPPSLQRPVGAFLVLFGLAVWFVATRRVVPHAAVSAIVAANVAWVAGSLAFVASDAASPTTAGSVWTALQAIVVALLATLQRSLNRAAQDSSESER